MKKVMGVMFLRHIFQYRLGWLLVAAHLACAALIVAEMPTYDEAGCTEAVISSPFDCAVADRPFFFNYSSTIARGLVLIDLPALMVGELLISTNSQNIHSSLDLSWIRAFTFFETTSIQWFAIGCLVDCFRQRRVLKRSIGLRAAIN